MVEIYILIFFSKILYRERQEEQEFKELYSQTFSEIGG